MSETKTNTKAETKAVNDPDELVDYTAPLLPGGKQKDVFCSVNGETCVIKRGIPVKIKRKFHEVLMNSNAQRMAAYQTMANIQNQSKKAAADM